MRPLSQVEIADLRIQISKAVCMSLTRDPVMIGIMMAVVRHAMNDHGATHKEARATWASIFAWSLRNNADVLESANMTLDDMISELEKKVTDRVEEIVKKIEP